MKNKMLRKNSHLAGVMLLLFITLITVGCSPRQKIMKIPVAGLSMKLPPGWKQGTMAGVEDRIKPVGERKYWIEEEGGIFYFESEKKFYPYGTAMAGSVPEGTSLREHFGVDKDWGAYKLLSTTPRNISGFEAIEMLVEGFSLAGEGNRNELGANLILSVGIKKGNGIIEVSFLALKEDFAKYESDFRESINSIKIR